jgi:hypothetical protein
VLGLVWGLGVATINFRRRQAYGLAAGPINAAPLHRSLVNWRNAVAAQDA